MANPRLEGIAAEHMAIDVLNEELKKQGRYYDMRWAKLTHKDPKEKSKKDEWDDRAIQALYYDVDLFLRERNPATKRLKGTQCVNNKGISVKTLNQNLRNQVSIYSHKDKGWTISADGCWKTSECVDYVIDRFSDDPEKRKQHLQMLPKWGVYVVDHARTLIMFKQREMRHWLDKQLEEGRATAIEPRRFTKSAHGTRPVTAYGLELPVALLKQSPAVIKIIPVPADIKLQDYVDALLLEHPEYND